jgi:hypothetical protein
MSAPRSPVRTDGTTTDLTLPAHTAARTHNPDLGTPGEISPAISVLLVDSVVGMIRIMVRMLVRMSSVAVVCSPVHSPVDAGDAARRKGPPYSGLGSI